MKKFLFSTFALALSLWFTPAAFAENIEQFISDIQINPDSSITVTEKILYNFGDLERRGIFREIPTSYGNSDNNIQTFLNFESVTDENGAPYEFLDQSYSSLASIRIGNPNVYLSGQHWYYITYTFNPAITFFKNSAELYWNLTGNGWTIPINYAEANITLPPGTTAEEFLEATCYTGYTWSTEQECQYNQIANTLTFNTTDTLLSGEGLTIVSSFNPDLVTRPTLLEVTSFPSYSNIEINGEPQYFSTPATFALSPGEYDITVTRHRYKTQTKTVTVQEEENTLIEFTLEQSRIYLFFQNEFPLILMVGGILSIFWLWWTQGKEPQGRGTIAPTFVPVDNLTASEIGVIIDQKAHMHDISAAVIDLAVKGYLKIKREEKKKLLGKKEIFSFIKTKNPTAKEKKAELTDFEISIFDKIFVGKNEVKLTDLQNKFYTVLPKVKKQLYQSVVDKGYFKKNPDTIRNLYLLLGIGIFFLALMGGSFVSVYFATGLYVAVGVTLGILMICISFFMPRRTKKGQLAYEEIQGLKMYLKTAEKDRFKKLHSPKEFKEHFEKLLPYAIALEVSEEWAEQFKGLFKTPPSWFEGTNTFNALQLSRSLNNFDRGIQNTFKSRPSSSGGSYSSGSWSGGSGFSGGFSGGGFGGGGGGSW